jgi:hypothetical protein
LLDVNRREKTKGNVNVVFELVLVIERLYKEMANMPDSPVSDSRRTIPNHPRH